MEIVQENRLYVLKENMFGELEWFNVNSVNLGSYKNPNKSVKQIKFHPITYFKQ